ncbi:MAG: ATP-binding protein [Trebonia sp.]
MPGEHYMLAPQPRLPDALELIGRHRYFVVHAPRQTGKTTSLAALARDLNAGGRYAALLFSCEPASYAGDDVGATGREILQIIAARAALGLAAELRPPSPWPEATDGALVQAGLTAWAQRCPRPLVLFFDEIDALRGKSLVSVPSQLRAGHNARPDPFPVSVALCGLRDLRDYRAASGATPVGIGEKSPFNIARSMRMSDFTRNQVAELYGQRTADTGQKFTPEAVDRAFERTQGQPYLVNAIASEITGAMGVKPPTSITAEHVEQAKERLILARQAHLDYLGSRLAEPRVQRVMEPLLASSTPPVFDPVYNDDVAYVRDLGLIAQTPPLRVANPIYKEVIARVLTANVQDSIADQPRDFLLPDGRLDMGRLLEGFAAFWKAFGASMAQGDNYHEAAAQLVFQAYLQRIVNGGGWVDREYGLGEGRTDLFIRKPYTGADGKPAVQREVIELKVRRQGKGNPLNEALAQLDKYLDQLGLNAGFLVIFDRRDNALRTRPNPVIGTTSTPSGRGVTLLTA